MALAESLCSRYYFVWMLRYQIKSLELTLSLLLVYWSLFWLFTLFLMQFCLDISLPNKITQTDVVITLSLLVIVLVIHAVLDAILFGYLAA